MNESVTLPTGRRRIPICYILGEQSFGPLRILANILISNMNFRNIFTLKQFLEFRPLEIKRKKNIHKTSKAWLSLKV